MSADKAGASPNAAQIDYWNAAAGATWAKYHDLLDRQVAPLGSEALRALDLQPGEHVLDIGCGCGHTTLEIAALVGGSGGVVGVDISEPMLRIAASRSAPSGSGRVEFLQRDAQTAELGQGRFDAAFSRFGVMFFGDPVAAFSNVRRALRRGGRLAFVCWRPLESNPWMLEPLDAARAMLPPSPPADPLAPGPFALADESRVRRILADAGFTSIDARSFEAQVGGGTIDEALVLALRVGPLGAALRENPDLLPRLAGPVRDVLERHVTAGNVRMAASVWIVSARAPG